MPSKAAIDDFKMGMRRLAGSACIIATEHEGERFGLVATAVCSVTADPPTLLVCINRTASMFEGISKSGHFSVSVLSEDQADFALAFASAKNRSERFETGGWTATAKGIPILGGAEVAFVCETSLTQAVGSHEVFFGNVSEVHVSDGRNGPAIWCDGQFGRLEAIRSVISA